jgi:putative RecB family exonuclease
MWSFSKLGTFERCKRRFKFIYMDKIRYQTTSVEAFMGTMVHEALDVLYQRVKIGKLLTLKQLEEEYKKKWEEDSKIYDEIKIVNKELSFDDYFSIGIKCLQNYYEENLDSLMNPKFKFMYTETEFRTKNILPATSRVKIPFRGKIDRIDVYDDRVEIHDYKTSASPPTELEIDTKFDYKQLPLYKRLLLLDYRFKDKEIRVVWHFLRHKLKYEKVVKDEELEEALDTIEKIVKEERKEQEYRPKKSMLCKWCDYIKICPLYSNEELVKKNPYDPDIVEGPKLAKNYIELRQKEKEIQNEISNVKDRLVEYSKKFSGEPVYTVQTEDQKKQITIKSTVEKKIPSSTDPLREDMEKRLKEKGVWEEFSTINSRSINSKINKEKLSDEMQDFFDMYTEEEEVREIRQSNIKKK